MIFTLITSVFSSSARKIWRKRLTGYYGMTDYLVSYVAWMLFWLFRKKYIEVPQDNLNFDIEVLVIPALVALLWVLIFWLNGLYNDTYRKSRLTELGLVLRASLIGVLIVSFITFLDDPIDKPTKLRTMVGGYTLIQFLSVGSARFALTTVIKSLIRQKKLGYRTLLIGCGNKAQDVIRELARSPIASGYLIQGYLKTNSEADNLFIGRLKQLGTTDHLAEIIKKRRIDELIIALEPGEQNLLSKILANSFSVSVNINVVPEMYDYLLGNVKINNLSDLPFVEVRQHLITPLEALTKRLLDVAISFVTLIFCIPVFIVLAILIRIDSPGPVFYLQERVGKGGNPFKIIKFRSMRKDAEKNGPSLSSDDDPRITRIGKFMRKTRLDEFPQFFNVLKGEMSLVGPRPERQYFINQIVERAPEYLHLLKVQPGITSWGQVKYGYAENVDQMIERLKYDLLYIENMSIAFDFKIIAYTVLTVLKGEGK